MECGQQLLATDIAAYAKFNEDIEKSPNNIATRLGMCSSLANTDISLWGHDDH